MNEWVNSDNRTLVGFGKLTMRYLSSIATPQRSQDLLKIAM